MMKNDLPLTEVDELGLLLAQIAELTAKADSIKDAIKDAATLHGASKTIEGNLFKVTVVESNRATVDWLNIIGSKVGAQFAAKEKADDSWKRVALKIGFEANTELPAAIANNTKTTAVYSVKTTTRAS